MDKILLIDGHNAMHRANISFGSDAGKHVKCLDCDALVNEHLADRSHCECGEAWDDDNGTCQEDFVMIFNFFRNLRPIIEDFEPDKCFFILEGRPQFRYDLFAEYKANRIIKTASKQDSKNKFDRNKDIIVPLLQYLPITIGRAMKYEADDLIATLCENMKDEELTVLSNDSDYIQLLQRGYSNLRIYNPIKKEDMVAPAYPYVAWKSLNGDTSDNIPALLTKKKAINTISDPELFKKFMAVEENRANFNINRQLIEFRSVPEEEIILTEGNRDFVSLKTAFQEMKFESITNDKSWNKYCKTFDCIKY
jgi:5'-3' exonuclease